MNDEIRMSFVAEDKEMLAAYRRMVKEVEKYKKELSELGKQSKQAEQDEKAAAKAREEAAKAAAKAAEKAAADKLRAEKNAAAESAKAHQRAEREAAIAAKESARVQEQAAKEAARAKERAAREAYKVQVAVAKEAAKESAKAQRAENEAMVQTIGVIAMGWQGVKAGINLASRELEDFRRRQQEAAGETISTADAQIKFFRNMIPDNAADATAMRDRVNQIAAEANAPAKNVYLAAAEASAAQGALSRDQMMENVKMGVRMAPDSLSEATAIAGALGDTASLTGSGNAAENAGLLLSIGELTRIPSMQQIAKTLVPAAIGVKASLPGTSTSDATALVATLTSGAKDREGALASTGAIQLAAQIDKYMSSDAIVGRTDRAGGALRSAGDGNLVEQIDKLRNDPQLREAFFQKASFEAKIKPFVEQLLTPGTELSGLYDRNRGRVPVGGAAVSQTDKFFATLAASPEQQVAALERKFTATQSQLQLADIVGAEGGVTRQGLQKVLSAANAGLMEQSFAGAMFDLQTSTGTSTQDAAIEQLRNRAVALRGWNPDDTQRATAASPTDEAMARRLDVMILELKGLRQDQKNAPKQKNIDQHNE